MSFESLLSSRAAIAPAGRGAGRVAPSVLRCFRGFAGDAAEIGEFERLACIYILWRAQLAGRGKARVPGRRRACQDLSHRQRLRVLETVSWQRGRHSPAMHIAAAAAPGPLNELGRTHYSWAARCVVIQWPVCPFLNAAPLQSLVYSCAAEGRVAASCTNATHPSLSCSLRMKVLCLTSQKPA